MKIHRASVVAALCALAFLAIPGVGSASPSADAMATVKKAVSAFNAGDMKTWVATCDSSVSIIDDFAPYAWYGATACADWWSALAAFDKQNKITSVTVVAGAPWRAVATGDRAYVVVPVTVHYNMNGKPAKDSGSVLTAALKKTANGWLMEAWSYSQH